MKFKLIYCRFVFLKQSKLTPTAYLDLKLQ